MSHLRRIFVGMNEIMARDEALFPQWEMIKALQAHRLGVLALKALAAGVRDDLKQLLGNYLRG